MTEPLSTGAAARLLGTTEPRLAELVRRGKIHPEPVIVAGRRLWGLEALQQAAEHLGVHPDSIPSRVRRWGGGAQSPADEGGAA